MPELKNVNKVIAALRAKAAKVVDSNVDCVVGYTASYAIYVHENLTAHHKPGKSAKFLEIPLRQLHDTFVEMIKVDLKAGRTMGQALLRAGLLLQRESQKICPVDTGNLRASAFTRLERDKRAAASA